MVVIEELSAACNDILIQFVDVFGKVLFLLLPIICVLLLLAFVVFLLIFLVAALHELWVYGREEWRS